MKVVFSILLALAACASAKPHHHSLLLPISPAGVAVRTAVSAPNCRETFQKGSSINDVN